MLIPLLLAAVSLSQQLEEIAKAAHGHVGAAAMVVESGRRASYHGAGRFPMQSVYKFPIAMAVLHQVDQGRLKLDRKIHVRREDLVPRTLHSPLRDEHPDGNVDVSLRDLLRYAVSESDGTASDVLMRIAGGAGRVSQYLGTLGVGGGIMVATTEAQMAAGPRVQYRNWATPDGAVKLLEVFEKGCGLSAGSRSLLLSLMTQSSPGPKRIKGLLPPGTVVAHKTGTSGTWSNGITAATNDIGLITLPDGKHLAVAVFVSDSPESAVVREAVIAKIARAAWEWAQQNRS